MKKLLLTAALVFGAHSAVAGGYNEVVIEPEVVVTEAVEASGSDEWVLGLMFFLIFLVALPGN